MCMVIGDPQFGSDEEFVSGLNESKFKSFCYGFSHRLFDAIGRSSIEVSVALLDGLENSIFCGDRAGGFRRGAEADDRHLAVAGGRVKSDLGDCGGSHLEKNDELGLVSLMMLEKG